MTARRARFPRAAYARRAQSLAGDLNDWSISLRELANGPDIYLVNFKSRGTAETRSYACEEAAMLAEKLVDAILGIR